MVSVESIKVAYGALHKATHLHLITMPAEHHIKLVSLAEMVPPFSTTQHNSSDISQVLPPSQKE
jgi:hypothetical protein